MTADFSLSNKFQSLWLLCILGGLRTASQDPGGRCHVIQEEFLK